MAREYRPYGKPGPLSSYEGTPATRVPPSVAARLYGLALSEPVWLPEEGHEEGDHAILRCKQYSEYGFGQAHGVAIEHDGEDDTITHEWYVVLTARSTRRGVPREIEQTRRKGMARYLLGRTTRDAYLVGTSCDDLQSFSRMSALWNGMRLSMYCPVRSRNARRCLSDMLQDSGGKLFDHNLLAAAALAISSAPDDIPADSSQRWLQYSSGDGA